MSSLPFPQVTGLRGAVLPDDLERFPDIGGVCLSADGALVAAVVSVPDIAANRYERVVFAGPADASAAMRGLGPGTATAAMEVLPAWAPAGHDLATVRQDEGGWSIWLHRLDDGTAEPLVSGWPDPIEELAWSPAGDRLLFAAREPADRARWELPEDRRPPLRITTLRYREDGVGWTVGRPRQGYVVPSSPGGKPRKISAGGFDDSEFGWHPDGHRVVFVSQRQPDADHTIVNDVYVQDVDAGDAAVRLTSATHACAQPRVSPDGALIALTVTDVPRFPSVADVAVLPVAGGPLSIVSADLDRDCNSGSSGMAGPVWDSAGGLTVLVEDAGAIHAVRLDPRGRSQPQLIAGGRRRVTSLAERNGTLAFVTTGPDQPPRLVVRPAGEAEQVVLAPSADTAAARDLRAPAYRQVLAGDGTAVDSWLTLPDPARWQPPYPLLLCLQGGGTQYGYQWSQEFQALNGAGFATLQVNPRGSAGYGSAWMRTVSGPDAATPGTGWGTVDVQDVLTVVRAVLAARDDLDDRRVGVQGGSYGGLVTTWLLAESDIFAAGWAERGPYNLVSLAGTNDESPWFFEAYLGRRVTDDPAAYWARSALRLAAQITAPIAIMHSEEDRRCPIQQAEELFMALKLLGRHAEFIRFPGEGHGLSRTGSPVHRLQRLELLIEWFTRWLRPVPSEQDGRTAPADASLRERGVPAEHGA
jgi:dipeptidyl aminopeptidase/acylaminoacyl peptidase